MIKHNVSQMLNISEILHWRFFRDNSEIIDAFSLFFRVESEYAKINMLRKCDTKSRNYNFVIYYIYKIARAIVLEIFSQIIRECLREISKQISIGIDEIVNMHAADA